MAEGEDRLTLESLKAEVDGLRNGYRSMTAVVTALQTILVEKQVTTNEEFNALLQQMIARADQLETRLGEDDDDDD